MTTPSVLYPATVIFGPPDFNRTTSPVVKFLSAIDFSPVFIIVHLVPGETAIAGASLPVVALVGSPGGILRLMESEDRKFYVTANRILDA
jgi:hypothetical protein